MVRRIRRFVVVFVLVVAAIWCGVVGYAYASQNAFILHPVRSLTLPPKGLPIEVVQLRGAGGSIEVWRMEPAADEARSKPTVLFLHGNGGDLGSVAPTLSAWHTLGYRVITFDYRGFGRSEGSANVDGAVEDARTVFAWMKAELDLDERNIIVHGHSLGGGVAGQITTREDICLLILESSFSSLPDLASDMVGPVMPFRLILKNHLNTVQAIRHQRTPVLVLHSVDDTVIPISHQRALIKAVPNAVRLTFSGVAHPNVFATQFESISTEIERYDSCTARPRS
jgi:uncharacterized protein